MSQFDNPFAAPLTQSPAMAPVGAYGGPSADAEAMRRKYIKHEASIRSVGILYYLGTIILGLASIPMLYMALTGEGGPAFGSSERAFITGMGVAYVILAVISYFLARGLRALQPGVRIPVGIFAAIGLLQIPIGTLINGYILYLVFSSKGKVVFSDQYRDVVRRTPHIKYKTSLVTWIVLIIFILLLAAAIGAAVVNR